MCCYQWKENVYKEPLEQCYFTPSPPFTMNALVLLFLPVALAASPDQRIVNGQNVNIANYPWQVCINMRSGNS